MIWTISEHFRFREEPFGGIVFDLRNGHYFLLNSTGSEILRLAIKGKSNCEISKSIIACYSFGKKKGARIREEVSEFLTQCENAGVICGERPGRNPLATESASKYFRDAVHLTENYRDDITGPLSVDFYPSLQCNQSCFFCYVPHSLRRAFAKPISYSLAAQLVDKLVNARILELSVLGGEPFLVPWMAEFLCTATSNHMKVDVTTNGTGITDEIAKKLRDLKHFSIDVSLHGHIAALQDTVTRTPGSFKATSKALETLVDNAVRVCVLTVVTRSNYKFVSDIFHLCDRMGVAEYALLYPYLHGFEPEYKYQFVSVGDFWKVASTLRNHSVKEQHNTVFTGGFGAFNFLEARPPIPTDPLGLLRARFCKAGVTKLDVLPDGSTYPCISLVGDMFRLGNIFEMDVEDMWQREPSKILRHRYIPTTCLDLDCEYAQTCRGGCPVEASLHLGAEDKADGRCPFQRNQMR